jgi:DNA-binding NtrC family response regulator
MKMERAIRVIVLEDNPFDAELMLRELKRADINYVSRIVHDRGTYVDQLDGEFEPDIILSDYTLPTFDGLEAFRIKQQLAPSVPFIIVSGTIGEERAVSMIKQGMSDFVLKENLTSLPQKVMRALEIAEEKEKKQSARVEMEEQFQKMCEIFLLQSDDFTRPINKILRLYRSYRFKEPAHPANAWVVRDIRKSAILLDMAFRDIAAKARRITSGQPSIR